MEKKNVVEQLLKQGSKLVKNLTVKNVKVTPKENYIRVCLTLDKPVKGYNADDDGNYTLGETKFVYVSLFSIAAIIRDNDDASFTVNRIIEKPSSVEVLLNGAHVDIIQQPVKAGEEYANPWSENDTVQVFDHDTLINHVVNITFNQRSVSLLGKLAESMLGI
jgi:hypothetical protein